jgi:hypothetical protein
MQLERQIVSLELSKKLKGLGVSQTAYWSWVFHKGRRADEDRTYILKSDDCYNFKKEGRCWSAFTVAELGEMLPTEVIFEDVSFKLAIWRTLSGWRVFYGGNDYCLYSIECENLAETLAKMLVYLLEQKLISLR